MTDAEMRAARFDGAVLLMPFNLRERARALRRRERETCEELRLRVGHTMTALLPEGERDLGGERVTRRDIELLVEISTGASVHAVREQLRRGYITVRGGYRVGLGGSVFLSDGEVGGFGAFSSANIRISRELSGVAEPVMPALTRGGAFRSTLIIAPPGAGKTTLLRDVIARLSDGAGALQPMRVSLADERGEVAALYHGVPQMYIGRHTDVLDGCPKAEAMMMLLRSMDPEVLAADEITAPEDVNAVLSAKNCGVELLATCHAGGVNDLRERTMYAPLIKERVFSNFVVIRRQGARREYQVIKGEEPG